MPCSCWFWSIVAHFYRRKKSGCVRHFGKCSDEATVEGCRLADTLSFSAHSGYRTPALGRANRRSARRLLRLSFMDTRGFPVQREKSVDSDPSRQVLSVDVV